ncbi:hypothetical protein AVEN_215058-1 [Araneus ventricosus]|uniref:Uncharacterized protein n=1 Tax=Araneus ventricosus TaxID=182803 RepID=A0A4Y2Q4V9_ARAVE|nr:hypothetical protein AVEN_215058-1 [Araneus ventricosus]
MDIDSQANETDELSKVIERLAGFRLLMSYMGVVGKIMGDSGLAEMWHEKYCKNFLKVASMGLLPKSTTVRNRMDGLEDTYCGADLMDGLEDTY